MSGWRLCRECAHFVNPDDEKPSGGGVWLGPVCRRVLDRVTGDPGGGLCCKQRSVPFLLDVVRGRCGKRGRWWESADDPS